MPIQGESKENQLHLTECPVIMDEYWQDVINLLVQHDMPHPEDTTRFLITGQIRYHSVIVDRLMIDPRLSGVLFLAWRCLYAAIQHSRLEGVALDLRKAYARLIDMIVSRLNAYGEKWKQWAVRGAKKRKTHIIPRKHHDKILLECIETGDYWLSGALLAEHEKTKQEMVDAQAQRRRDKARSQRPTRPCAHCRAPPAATSTAPATADAAMHAADAAAATPLPGPADTEIETKGIGLHADMSGDAITTAQLSRSQHLHAQCSLSAVRNLRRNPQYAADRLAEICATRDYAGDIRFPDWPRAMSPMLSEGEVIKRVSMSSVRAEELSDVRAGVIMTILRGTHAIAMHNADDGSFHIYDNDSLDRIRGVSTLLRGDEIKDRFADMTLIAIMAEAAPLSLRLGAPITTLVHRRRRPRKEIAVTEVPPPPRRRRQIQITSMFNK